MKPTTLFALTLAASPWFAGCGDGSKKDADRGPAPVVAPELRTNQLAEAPSTFLGSAADSPVNWQNWNPELIDKATESRRLIFALVGSARYPGCFEVLEILDSNPAIVRRLNEDFVPVLVDLDLNRETGLIAYNFSPETGKPVAFPFLFLLSPEGSPVTWQPLQYTSEGAVLDFLDNSADVVSRMWSESPDYVLRDSAEKLALRREFLAPPDPDVESGEEQQEMYREAIRRINSFYDEDLTAVAGSGGVFPIGLLDCLAIAQTDATLPARSRQACRETLKGLAGSVMESAMIDPLDGGIYPARRGASWELPMFQRECLTQARSVRVFARIHQLGLVPEALRVAIDAVHYAEEAYRTPEGLFALTGKPGKAPDREWLWTYDQVSSVLNPEELAVWESLSELDTLGNLPAESNTSGRYFRLNSLARRNPPEAIAAATGFDPAKVAELIDSGRRKLAKARESRFPAPRPDPKPSALASFRMVSAYAGLFAATGDDVWHNKALELGTACRSNFTAARFINERPDGSPEGMSDGRAFTYAVAAAAALDLGAVTLDDQWYVWAQDLTTLLGEHFVTEQGRLAEVRAVSKVVDLDFEDRMMVFDDSTVGLTRLNLSRLTALGLNTPPQLEPWRKSLPNIRAMPIVVTDTISAMIHGWNHVRIDVGPDAPAALRRAATTCPLDLYERRTSPEAGAGARLTPARGEAVEITDPSQLRRGGDSEP